MCLNWRLLERKMRMLFLLSSQMFINVFCFLRIHRWKIFYIFYGNSNCRQPQPLRLKWEWINRICYLPDVKLYTKLEMEGNINEVHIWIIIQCKWSYEIGCEITSEVISEKSYRVNRPLGKPYVSSTKMLVFLPVGVNKCAKLVLDRFRLINLFCKWTNLSGKLFCKLQKAESDFWTDGVFTQFTGFFDDRHLVYIRNYWNVFRLIYR